MEELIRNLIFPNPALIFAIAILSIADLFGGILKSRKKGVATVSKGFDKTITKIISYMLLIALGFVVTNVSVQTYDLSNHLDSLNIGFNSICAFMIYREIKSILENVILANTDKNGKHNDLAKFLIPIHNAIIFKFNTEFKYNESKEDIIKKLEK